MIGYHTAQHLLNAGHDVTGVDLITPDKGPMLKEWRMGQLETNPRFTPKREDVRDHDTMGSLFQDGAFDGVLHLAAMAGVRDSLEDPHLYHETNATATLNLLEHSRHHDVDDIVIASTSSLYGHQNDVPFTETARTDQPPSPYAASKKAAEAYASTYNELYGIDAIVPRYFTVYGPAGRPDMAVFRFVRWISEDEPLTVYGDGTQQRDFTYVTDIARGTVACLDADGFEIINLGNDDPVELKELITTIQEHVGKEGVIEHEDAHPADMDATWADISKARKLLGWEPKVPLDEGIRRTVEWWEREKNWALDVSLS